MLHDEIHLRLHSYSQQISPESLLVLQIRSVADSGANTIIKRQSLCPLDLKLSWRR